MKQNLMLVLGISLIAGMLGAMLFLHYIFWSILGTEGNIYCCVVEAVMICALGINIYLSKDNVNIY